MMNKLLVALVLTGATLVPAEMELRSVPTTTELKLPKPLSDATASVGQDGLIYIAGGCDSAFGNQYIASTDTFRCTHVSRSFYAFDPLTDQFETLPDMPDPRHRHTAVAINNQIWLVGGRDGNDAVVGRVHVYDINDGRWRTFRDLHETYWVSDSAGFSANGRAYIVGGFTEGYRAVSRVFSIDPAASWKSGRLEILRHANLVHRRGDIGVVVNANETLAFVSGGSTHENHFCSPLHSVERYDLVTSAGWEELAPLTQARTGKTVLEVNNQLVAIGGAQAASKLCDKTVMDPSNMQTPVYDIETYNDGTWHVSQNLNQYHFRSAMVTYEDAIYSFGGQSNFFSVCECHPTVDDIVIYRQGSETEDRVNAEQNQDGNYGTAGFGTPNDFNQETDGANGTTGTDTLRNGDEQTNGAYNKDKTGFSGYQQDESSRTSGSRHIQSNMVLVVAIGAVAALFM